MRRLVTSAVLAVLCCGVVGCSDADDPVQAEATSTTAGPSVSTTTVADDPDTGYQVGRRSITVVDDSRGGRTLPVEVWYPVAPDADLEGLTVSAYPLLGESRHPSAVSHDDAPAARGPFPLVVFSHGNGGNRMQSVFLTEALAAAGFVVASPDHVGNTTAEVGLGAGIGPAQVQSAVDRPLDIELVIDRLLAVSADPADPLSGRVDPERIGVTGHSFGGLTSLLVALATGGEPYDARIDAIAPLAPASGTIDDKALGTITVPMLVMGGTLDTTTPVDPNVDRPFDLVGSRIAYRAVLRDANHLSFSDVCAHVDGYRERPDADPGVAAYVDALFEGACADEYLDVEVAHRLIVRYVVGFFRSVLAGDEHAADALVSTGEAEVSAR